MSCKEKFGGHLIVVDTRESLPLQFPGAIKKALASGDYSLIGFEDQVTIERKTLEDFYQCVGRERNRFTRELERLEKMDYAAVVIESSLSDILHGTEYSQVHPRSAIGSILSWSVKYGIPFFFAENRKRGRLFVYHLLKKYWEYNHDNNKSKKSE